MILLTVGTYPLPFDRLVTAVDTAVMEGLIEEKVFAQIGFCRYRPRNIEYVEMLQKGTFDSYFQKATGIIGHAGMGTITMSLNLAKPLLVMPRMKRFGEHVNDHQVAIVKRFELLGHVLVAYEAAELPAKIKQLKSFVPCKRKAQPQAVVGRIAEFLNELSKKGKIL